MATFWIFSKYFGILPRLRNHKASLHQSLRWENGVFSAQKSKEVMEMVFASGDCADCAMIRL